MEALPGYIGSGSSSVALANIKSDTALAIRSSDLVYMITAKDILEWVAPTAPIREAMKFLVISQSLNLNPLLGETFLLPLGGKWTTVIGKHGYLKCARADPHFDGLESGITIQPFTKAKDKPLVFTGPMIDIQGTVLPAGMALSGGWCKMYRKGVSRPFYKRVSILEYQKSAAGPWQAIPCTMIEKVAIAQCAREAIDLLSGTYDESEIDRVAVAPQQARIVSQPAPVALASIEHDMTVAVEKSQDVHKVERNWVPGTETLDMGTRPKCSPEQVSQITELIERLKMSPADYARMLDKRGVTRLEDIDTFEASTIVSNLNHHASKLEWEPFGSPPGPETAPVIAVVLNPSQPETIDPAPVADANIIDVVTE